MYWNIFVLKHWEYKIQSTAVASTETLAVGYWMEMN